EAGSLLTCRKRSMLSGLSCEVRGIGSRARSQAPKFHRDSSYFFQILRNFFLSTGIYKQANTRPASRPPSDWLDSPRGEIREAGRPGPPPFSFSIVPSSKPTGRTYHPFTF